MDRPLELGLECPRTSLFSRRRSTVLARLLLRLSLFQERLGDEDVILGRNAPVQGFRSVICDECLERVRGSK